MWSMLWVFVWGEVAGGEGWCLTSSSAHFRVTACRQSPAESSTWWPGGGNKSKILGNLTHSLVTMEHFCLSVLVPQQSWQSSHRSLHITTRLVLFTAMYICNCIILKVIQDVTQLSFGCSLLLWRKCFTMTGWKERLENTNHQSKVQHSSSIFCKTKKY